jgi:hypothetical protein
MWTSRIWPIAGICVVAWAASAAAEQQATDVPPPRLEKLEEGAAPVPAATAGSKAPARQITQKREQGVVTEVQVKDGKSTYYLKPNTPGSAAASDAQGDTTRTPQWKVLEFDWGGRPPEDKKATAQGAASAPPPPNK